MSTVIKLPEGRAVLTKAMYPDLPESPADLVPLPHCDGRKLKLFDFGGPQKIEFLVYIGEGGHSHVFKVKIRGQVYALELFKFLAEDEWYHVDYESYSEHNLEAVSAMANYSEPFYAGCRAFGRLQETYCEDLATKCFGYGRLADFSMAITTPHYITDPELNSYLTSEQISTMEYHSFALSYGGFRVFDVMILESNIVARKEGKPVVSVHALPHHRHPYYPPRYHLRSMPSRMAVHTLANPKKYDWRKPVPLKSQGLEVRVSKARPSRGKAQGNRQGGHVDNIITPQGEAGQVVF